MASTEFLIFGILPRRWQDFITDGRFTETAHSHDLHIRIPE